MRSLNCFQCRRCGKCCRWEGPVRVTQEEISAIAAYLSLPEEVFIRDHTVLAYDRKSLSLKEKPDGSCAWLNETDNACLLQSVKPAQCRNFPAEWNFPGWDSVCEGGKALHEGSQTETVS